MYEMTFAPTDRQWQYGERVLRVCVDLDAYAYFMACVEATSGEITLFGCAEFDTATNTFQVTQFLLPDQVCSFHATTVSDQALADLLVAAVERGLDVSTLRVWAHSHGARMDAYFSAQDKRTIREAFPQADWTISIVTNAAGKVIAWLNQARPFPISQELPLTIGVRCDTRMQALQDVRVKVQQGYDRGASAYATGGAQQQDVVSCCCEHAHY